MHCRRIRVLKAAHSRTNCLLQYCTTVHQYPNQIPMTMQLILLPIRTNREKDRVRWEEKEREREEEVHFVFRRRGGSVANERPKNRPIYHQDANTLRIHHLANHLLQLQPMQIPWQQTFSNVI